MFQLSYKLKVSRGNAIGIPAMTPSVRTRGVLPSHKVGAAAKFQQKGLQVVEQRPFEISFQQTASAGKTQKIPA